MGKVSQWFIAHRPSTRRLAQLYAALLYNANLKGFIRGELYTGQAKNLCVPGLNCYSCPGAVAACPLGAIYGLFNRFALTGMRVDADRCTRCGACVRVCKTDIRQVGDRECISCGKCMDVCAHGAISMRCGKITLKGPDLPGKENVPEKQHTIGGGASHPRTLVLNRRGEVTYNEPGSISADKLAELFTDADSSTGGKGND